MRLESKILEEKNRNESLQSYTATISHEFRTPLGTSLMFLESLLKQDLSENTRYVLLLIVSQLNLLLSLINDVLDMKLIKQGVFEQKMEEFDPREVFQFILAMFGQHAEIQGT